MKACPIVTAICLALLTPGAYLCAQEEESALAESFSEFQSEMALQEADAPLSQPAAPHPASTLKWYSMFTNIPGDWLTAGQSAFSPEGLPVVGGIVLATGILMVGDHAAYSYSHGLYTRSADIRFASNQIIRAGDGKTVLGVAAAFAIYGFAGDDDRALRTASGTVEALLASGIAVQLFKRIAGRESPQVATHETGAWRPFPGINAYNRDQPRYYAFPSGHITTVMATVTVIAENYSDQHWIRPVGYGIVGLTAMSLVNKGWHWYSDFPLALALGYTFGHIAAHHYDDVPEDAAGKGSASLSVQPNIGPEGAGVMLALRF
ncbi:MAG TPA: phosphatase PAP2 family protein [Bacteroidota bacterium]|nr:phosphatase PAP2 family protein [Bacteroidota bacterium]